MWRTSLSEGFKTLDEEKIDIILLDLNLPDSDDLASVERTSEKAPEIPIIVLTGIDDEGMALNALHAGAQDYLVKGQIHSQLIVRAIRYTIERLQLLKELEDARDKERQQRDLNFLQRMESSVTTNVTARAYGVISMRLSAPAIYAECVDLYKVLLQQALVQKAYKVEYGLSEKSKKMAEAIGFIKGGPRDVIEIYTQALKELSLKETRIKTQAIIEEGRIIVLELMGHLVSFYRNYSLDFRKKKE